MTPEQEKALEELLRHIPAPTTPPPQDAGFLQTWLGLSEQEIQNQLLSLMQQKDKAETLFLEWVEGNPLDAAFIFLGMASAAFYRAEKGINPRVNTYTDAFYYISTCASVGYADIFAITQTGKAIAALVMIVGPALAAKSLDRPRSSYEK
ncbi:MAG: two pore domain potassium channel family protein [Chloroflexi bacterium]|nr:two pore domain potassium channel family protein [Chloroflexota bacterium]MBP8055855.1 two pore domain potassium channel family protein [Chloroflexota bacterium]